ncbi:L-cysteine desulfidase family protein [[Clostridium] colinum]|uniref:L-cysteine desulfidase family protein n=1 Tax=[Clostridium] colinum TaxID=36835 RepID=UPI002ED274AC
MPNTNGLIGIGASAITGVLAGDATKELETISLLDAKYLEEIERLINTDYCIVMLLDTPISLHVIVEVYSGEESASVEIKQTHTNITKIVKNDEIIFSQEESEDKYLGVFVDRNTLHVKDIYDFANNVNLDDVKELLDSQIEKNFAIAKEGIKGAYGTGIGKVLLNHYSDDITIKIKAYTAAASEARMSGSPMPVVTNSGSGNQGITVSVPLVVYAKEKNISKEKLYRGLVLSNLLAIHQKTLIGRLSAFCGVVSAACASGAGITYLAGGNLKQIEDTITNTLANISGIVCDGAKPACGAKIASSLDGALMGHYLAMENKVYKNNTGILKDDVEKTINAVGRLGKEGMKQTDTEILNIMLDK